MLDAGKTAMVGHLDNNLHLFRVQQIERTGELNSMLIRGKLSVVFGFWNAGEYRFA